MKRVKAGSAWLLSLGLGVMLPAQAADFDPAEHDGVAALVAELSAREIPAEWLNEQLRAAVFQQSVLDAMAGAAERRLRWDEYRAIFMQPERVAEGVDFIDAHHEAFARAESEFGVPPEVIAAIIGVETRFGQFKGRHRVLDSLATLAFHHPRRGDFFRGELAAFLEITHEQGVEPGEMMGSYAGAMGYPQFIPTSYRAYAVDFDGDGIRDLWFNPVDAIGSVANYFAEHRWRPGEPIYADAEGPEALPDGIDFNRTRPPYAELGRLASVGIGPMNGAYDEDARVIPLALDYQDEAGDIHYRYRLGHHNFYVITRYNHSHLYAMAVTELAEAIAAAREEDA
ncbi:lytic murein transglycosylase B [Halomonas sp. 328]|uniref:lytic murein transglycosylase B n=1 Tax=Halomonas sp. 328 TaxID=2776704 RepID=UPI0018A7D0AA|nr:lytic murein transglycosylase B [Halomonas sp. 328]MBF8221289.1 lytic murein transglycosylase B [Halomonas sp. 328]